MKMKTGSRKGLDDEPGATDTALAPIQYLPTSVALPAAMPLAPRRKAMAQASFPGLPTIPAGHRS